MWMTFFNRESRQVININSVDRSSYSTLLSRVLPPYSNSSSLSKESKELLLGVVCGVILFPIRLAIMYLEDFLRIALDRSWGEDSILDAELDFRMITLICVICPIIEELLFRGFLTPVMRSILEKTGVISPNVAKAVSISGSSLLFASTHSYGSISSRTLGAIAYELLAVSTDGNLRSSIAAHSTHNSICIGGVLLGRQLRGG